jgi:hypothetical protein
MAVGNQPTAQVINSTAGRVAVNMRQVMEAAKDLETQVNKLGTAGLEAAPISMSPADAAALITLVNYLSTVAGCYYGTVQQGGSGGTGAITFNFDDALSVLWGFQ